MIIDTHIHLDDTRYEEDFDAVMHRAEEAGVQRFIIPGADADTLGRAVALAEQYEHIYFSVGTHPYDREKHDGLDYAAYLSHPKCVAVGECGLDYYRLEGTPEEKAAEKAEQQRIFREQIRLAKRFGKPLIVHIRDASADAKAILLEEGAGEVGGVLHCYNADAQLLSLAEEDFCFGIGGVLTFKNARKLVEVLPKIPREKLLVETDGPYLTPHPHRGKRNEPLYTTLVVAKMAELLGSDPGDIAALTTENARRLFHIS
jgi:TatD DNase family protein